MAKAVTLKNSNGDELYPTTIAELVNGLDDTIYSLLYYKPGDTVAWENTSGGPTLGGCITSNNKALRFFIPLGKRLDNVSSASLSRFNCLCRIPAGGYATGLDLSSGDLLAAADTIYYEVIKEMNGIYVQARSATNWAAVNNIPVTLEVLEMTLTLS